MQVFALEQVICAKGVGGDVHSGSPFDWRLGRRARGVGWFALSCSGRWCVHRRSWWWLSVPETLARIGWIMGERDIPCRERRHCR